MDRQWQWGYRSESPIRAVIGWPTIFSAVRKATGLLSVEAFLRRDHEMLYGNRNFDTAKLAPRYLPTTMKRIIKSSLVVTLASLISIYSLCPVAAAKVQPKQLPGSNHLSEFEARRMRAMQRKLSLDVAD